MQGWGGGKGRGSFNSNTLAPTELKVPSSQRSLGRGRSGQQPNYLRLINVLSII